MENIEKQDLFVFSELWSDINASVGEKYKHRGCVAEVRLFL